MTSRRLRHWIMSIALVASFPVSAQLDATFRVAVVHAGPGEYTHEGPMWAGLEASLGPVAVLRTAGIDILCATNLLQLLDRNMFRIAGIEPTERRILVVKSSQHFRAAFGPIAGEILVVDGGGLTTRDYSRMPFRRLRRPIFPLDLQ